MIKAIGIHKSYGKLEVLKGVDIEVSRAEIVSIVGARGAGKSTLMHIIGTLDRPDKGIVEIGTNRVSDLSEKKMAHFRNTHIGFVFQFHHLLPEFNALENICIPAFIAGKQKAETEEKARGLLRLLGLENRATHKPAELSGGEQQRIAVARALINDPAVVMADEPSGNLDSASAKELHTLFFSLREKLNQTFVIVTHNEGLADMADRKLLMKDGRMI
jgi:lipoprotein-releasing system ATP-binding protein